MRTNAQMRLEQGAKMTDGYWCVVCGRFLEADDDGVIVHDAVEHPIDMTFNDEENAQ
jgi:hypothetical protein